MTMHTTALSLFASTIACGLGLALSVHSAAAAVNGEATSFALLGGLALMLLGGAAFLGIASRAVRGDETMLKVVFASFAAGLLSVWFWLVPAQTAVITVACHYGNISACETVSQQPGFAASVALSNDDFVVHKCEGRGEAPYCRLAAAKRILHPTRFCPRVKPENAFEVVEWCTPSRDGDLLVAKR